MNESETRAELIDPHLKAQGWGEIKDSRIRREYPITKGQLLGNGRRSNPDKADYILQYNNRNIAVVEAKSTDSYYTDGLVQAKKYAQRLNLRFAISTNGLKYYLSDLEGSEGDIKEVPTPSHLWNILYGTEQTEKPAEFNWKQKFFDIPFETKGGTWELRYYQQNAVNAVLNSIAEDKKRILLTLATGTGKTAVAFQIAWKLFNARWNIRKDGARLPRILFLADRNILADQAFNAFGAFEDDALVRIKPSEITKKGSVPKNGSIFFTIFQTFMTGNNSEKITELDMVADEKAEYEKKPTANFGQYPKDFFDFIIIDECHRGGANDESSWRAILEYFSPATQLGLTATPKRDTNADTYDYFGKPVYEYSLKQGINDGFLTPFRVKQIDTNFKDYQYTSDDRVLQGEIDTEKIYSEADFNKIIEIKEREEFRVKEFLKLIDQKQKTLVFCATQIHALAIRDLINQLSESKNPLYCQRVTADDGAMGEKFLRDFQDNEKTIPTILTTSEKLSTGVDAPEIRNIILLRPVNSMIEFKQIVGRGTRLYDNKDYFTIFDFVEAYKHFRDPAWDGPPLDPVAPIQKTEKPVCKTCDQKPCICKKVEDEPCEVCGYNECRCAGKRTMIEVKLSDGKVRQFQSMITTSFWSADGRPISAQEFLKQLYGTLPSFFTSEDDLREQWSIPSTRKKLLDRLSEKGFSKDQLKEFQKILNAEDSDIFDVLSYVAYNSEIINRKERANKVKTHFLHLDEENKKFLEFVLDQYIQVGVDELDDEKLKDFLQLKYHTIKDAKEKLGDVTTIRNNFIYYQKYLYN
ncbi:EcoAI/FtnUII family type I restriction enzme subunit R [Chryseobacterium sp. 5_R23647]|uniref:EcoAI/FtnUII family type I restriction enzme subunit R n=1 Tax=Chryseobacterium sp. 5_R23647 TaxID=2258964 RepID=UPI000E27C2F1|nr:type I restriction endonuclease subunit R [Chryseobacterium sp. 5_R23647]REC40903.1 restriction endonuclease subunit R [Chryseobacterium sp. 5_R23647]